MTRAQSALLDLVNSDSDDEFASQLGIQTSTTTKAATARGSEGRMPAAKQAAARGIVGEGAKAKATKTATAASKVTKPAAQTKNQSGRRTSGRLAAAVENSDEGRAVLGEKSANQQPTAAPKATKGRKAAVAKDVDTIDESVMATPPPAKTKGARGRPKKIVAEDDEIQETQQEPAPKPQPARRGRKPAASKPRAGIEIPETQQDAPEPYNPEPSAMDLDLTMDPGLEDLPSSPAAPLVPQSVQRSSRQVPQSANRHRPLSATSTFPTAAVPASDDPVALRRRIGELTRQHAALESRYRDLRDVAARDAEANFDRLRKQTDERAAAAASLVDALRSELAAQRDLAREGARCKTQLDACESRAADLERAVAELTAGLAEARAENKNLSVKLAAARGTEAAKAAVPGSAVKNGLLVGKTHGEGIHAATVMQMKEDLYGDLTGLIVRGVKNVGGEDVFDCLQTGRNGSKYFPSFITLPPYQSHL